MKRLGDCEENSGHSVWENTDADLVGKIKDFKLVLNYENDMMEFYGECEVIKELSDTELLIIDKDKKHHVFNKPPAKEKFLNALNEKFFVGDHFGKNFGNLKLAGELSGSKVEVVLGISASTPRKGRRHRDILIADMETVRTSFHRCMEFNYSKHGSYVFCHFNKDGNYVIRDYNLDLRRYEEGVDVEACVQAGIDRFIEEASRRIDEELYHIEGSDTWFSETFAYKVHDGKNRIVNEVYVDVKPVQSVNTYYHCGNSRSSSKLSKKCRKEIVTKNSFLNMMRVRLEECISKRES